MTQSLERKPLKLPNGHGKILLHSCCAPCSGEQINYCGVRAAVHYPDLIYWECNWRKGGGSAGMIEIGKRESFYRQEYCGCVYSLRDTNQHRVATGRERIRLGEVYYGQAPSGELGAPALRSRDAADTTSSS